MSVGFPVNKQIIDQTAGGLVDRLHKTFDGIESLKAWLDAHTDAEVEAYGYTTEDVAVLKSAITDLDKLRRIAAGVETQANVSDFFFWAARLTGLT